MRIFFDTEFIDLGPTAALLSLGAIREDGITFYSENMDCPQHLAGEWVIKNVLPGMTGPQYRLHDLALRFEQFCGPNPEFWAYYGTYDWWLVMQLYGGFFQLPYSWPRYFNELATLFKLTNFSPVGIPKTDKQHNAMFDAMWNRQAYDAAIRQSPYVANQT